MDFTFCGQSFEISPKSISEKLKGVKPRAVQKYYIVVGKVEYPIKQVLSEVTEIPPMGFTSQDAYRILNRLGIEILQRQR